MSDIVVTRYTYTENDGELRRYVKLPEAEYDRILQEVVELEALQRKLELLEIERKGWEDNAWTARNRKSVV